MKTPRTAGGGRYDTRFYRAYRGTLVAILRRPILSLLVVVAIFVASLQGVSLHPQRLLPERRYADSLGASSERARLGTS
jgi:multidrug efflux pump subunit AcrB